MKFKKRNTLFQLIVLLFFISKVSVAQLKWINVDSLYQPLPASVHVFFSNDSLNGKPNRSFYLQANLKDKSLNFTTDTSRGRRFTPAEFYKKESNPLVVVNGTFFSFADNRNLNLVMKDGKLVAYNLPTAVNKKDTTSYYYISKSAIGISKKRMADVGWIYTDTAKRWPYVLMRGPAINIGKNPDPSLKELSFEKLTGTGRKKMKWKMQTAIGGGPTLVKRGEILITNNQEKRFEGNGINDKHPRTAMGYTRNGELIIMLIEGRYTGKAEGASLTQEAQMLKDVGCWEALNLDGGGSSCMLVNGKQTITPSEKGEQRPVPAVFMIQKQ